MKIEGDGHLNLGVIDLQPMHRDDPPCFLRPAHFTREARIAVWYAMHAGAKITFAMPGRLEQLDHPPAAWT
jgi:hypothetical protein